MQMGGMDDVDTRQYGATEVECAVCRVQVPTSEAMSFEASDYVAHFCGLDCYQKWLAASRTPGDDTF